MDLKSESKLKEDFSQDPRGFVSLFEDSFSELYRFVARRVRDEKVREQVCELVYMDALGQMGTCPKDFGFSTWLYRLAHGRISEYRRGSIVGPVSEIESPVLDGISLADGVYDDENILKDQAEVFFSALTQVESEIIRMKFFEDLTDGEVMFVLDLPEGEVGKMIYQVLKRGYELLFGEVDARGGVYHGELHSFLSRLKNIEKIPVAETFKLKLKTDLISKIDKMYRDSFDTEDSGASGASGVDVGARDAGLMARGSNDPAKVFVEAAKGMSKEEVDKVTEDYVREREASKAALSARQEADFEDEASTDELDQRIGALLSAEGGLAPGEREVTIEEMAGQGMPSFAEEEVPVQYVAEDLVSDDVYEKYSRVDRLLESWDRWKYVLSLVPSTLFIAAVVVVLSIVFLGKFENEGVTGLTFDVDYQNGFAETVADDLEKDPDYEDKVYVENEFVSKIAEGKEVSFVRIARDDGRVNMMFEIGKDYGMEYVLEEFGDGYKVAEFRKF